MKSGKVLAAVLGLGLVGTSAFAGEKGAGRDPEARQEQRLDRLRQELKLTDEQARKVQAIFEDARVQAQADAEAASGDRESLQRLARERHRAVHEKIEALLTDEQKARAAQLRQEHKQRVRERLDSYSR